MARRPGPPISGAVRPGLVGGGGGPEEAGQLTSAGDNDDIVWLAAGAHPSVDAVQALLGAVCDLKDVVGLALLAVGQRGAQSRRTAVVPGRLDQQPAGEHRPGLGDRALAG